MNTHVWLAIRRAVPVVLLAAAATFAGNPAIASAEWDVGQYDSCIDHVLDMNMAGDITALERDYEIIRCCFNSGGVVDGSHTGGCGAPPAVAASNTPRPGAPAANADPDVGPGTGTGPQPTKNPPRVPTAPAGDNDGGTGSGSGGQNDGSVG